MADNMNPRISILMPVRNAMPYLKECLESIQNQSFTDWELIAVDNQSTDGSFELLCKHTNEDGRIRVFQNSGEPDIIPAIQLAFSKVLGTYVTRMDADDVMHAYKLEKLLSKCANEDNHEIVVGGVEYFSDGHLGEGFKKYASWLNGLTRNSSNFEEIYYECVIPSPCWMARKKDLEEIGAFEKLEYPDDYSLTFQLYENNFKVNGISDVLHFWRDYPDRNSRTDPKYTDQQFFDLKVKYFEKCDLHRFGRVFLWGAGKKGKKLAKTLIRADIDFTWLCENTSKIGHVVYDKTLQLPDFHDVFTEDIILLAVSSADKSKIRERLSKRGLSCFSLC